MAKTPEDSRLELLQGTLDMLSLRTLQWGPQHGHGVGQAIRSQSEDLLKVETGSLYPALHRLEKRGWIQGRWVEQDGQRRRRYYKLTPAGSKILVAQRSTWREFIRAINLITGVEPA